VCERSRARPKEAGRDPAEAMCESHLWLGDGGRDE